MKRIGETGAALLSVLLLVAVMAALIAVSFDRLGLALRVAGNRDAAREARWDMISAETIARDRIRVIGAGDRLRSAQGWAGQSIAIRVPGGTLTATLTDAGNCFNLNALVRRDANGILTPNAQSAAQLIRLLIVTGEPPQTASALVAATSDWLDSDSVEAPGGAEAQAYARQSPVRIPANMLIDDPSEWLGVRGMSAALFARLAPLVCALPVAETVPLNINSLTPDQAMLLASHFSSPPAGLARVIADRPAGGWHDAAALLAAPALRGAMLADGAALGLRSQWFQLDLDARLADATVHETALFDARIEPVRLVRRSFGEP